MQKVRTVTAWLKCILQEFGTLYWTITPTVNTEVNKYWRIELEYKGPLISTSTNFRQPSPQN